MRLDEWFRHEIVIQCRYAIMAFDDLCRALAERDDQRFWYSVHAFLGFAANVSRLLYSGVEEKACELAKLRQDLELDEAGPLSDRKMRNHYEHYDERLHRVQRWLDHTEKELTGRPRPMVIADHVIIGDRYHGPPCTLGIRALPRGAPDPQGMLRLFYWDTFELSFQGDRLDVMETVEAIRAVLAKLESGAGGSVDPTPRPAGLEVDPGRADDRAGFTNAPPSGSM